MAAREIKRLDERIVVAIAATVVTGLGLGLNVAPAGWSSLFYLALPAVIVTLAVLMGRKSALIGGILAALALLLSLFRAGRAGDGAGLVAGVFSAALCLTAGILLPPFLEGRRLRMRVERQLGEQHSFPHLMETLLDEALRVAKTEVGEVLLRSNGKGGLERIVAKGMDALSPNVAARSGEEGVTVAEWALRKGRSCLYHIESDTRTTARTVAAVPLCGTSGAVGVLCVYSAAGRSFGQQELTQLQIVADEGAAAIYRPEFRDDLTAAHAKSLFLSTPTFPTPPQLAPAPESHSTLPGQVQFYVAAEHELQRVARELSTTFDQEEILHLVLQEAMQASAATCGAVLRASSQLGGWTAGPSIGYTDAEEDSLGEQLAAQPNSALAQAVQIGRTYYVADTAGDGLATVGKASIRSALFAPIWRGTDVYGMIILGSEQVNGFSADVHRFVETLILQAAVAIGNVLHYNEQLVHAQLPRMDHWGHVLKVSQAVLSDQPVEELLAKIASVVQESVGFDIVLISVLEGEPPTLRRVAGIGIPTQIMASFKRVRQPWQALEVVMRDEFRISQSYYIPAEERNRWQSLLNVYDYQVKETSREPGCWHPQDMLLVPLMGPGMQVRGLMSVDAPHNGKMPDYSTIEALEVFASQAALAIENALLLEDLRHRLGTLSVFSDLSRSVAAKLDLKEVLNTAVHAAAQLANCDGSVLFLQDLETGRYTARAAHGHNLADLEKRSFAPGEWLVGRVVSGGKPISVADVEAEAAGDGGYIRQGPIVLVPLAISGQVVGVLTADRPRKGTFVLTDMATLKALSSQVSVAVQNALLFDEAVHRTQELSTLLEASSAISSTLDLKWVLKSLGDRLLSIAGADNCLISEWDRDLGAVTVIWDAKDGEESPIVGVVYPASQRPQTAEALLTQQPLLLSKEGEDEGDEQILDYLLKKDTRSELLVPMVARGQTVGLVELAWQQRRRAFTSDVVRLTQALANQAASAVQNARLFEQIRHFSEELEQRVAERTQELGRAMQDLTTERDRMEVLYRIAAEVSASLDVDRVLNRTLNLAVEAVGADQGFILLEKQETGRLVYRSVVGVPMRIPPGGIESRIRRGEGLAGWVVERGEALLVPDLHEDGRWTTELERDPAHRACLAAPLGAAGEMLGVLLLFSAQPGVFDEAHLRLAEAAAAQIANAVGNAALYNLIREQTERLGATLKQQQVDAAKSQAILEGVADGVVVADARGRVILFNVAAQRILEIPREEALGRSTREMLGLYGVEGRAWLAAIDDWAANPASRTPEDFVAERIDMGSRVVSAHLAPVIMGSEYLGTVSVFRDITTEVRADQAKSDFVSTVSHELRTPMTSIKGYADLLLMGAVGALSEQQTHFLSIIRSNADRLTVLVNDLLDISRIETGRVELSLGAIHIHEMVNQVVSTLEGRAQSRNQTLTTVVREDLPAIWGDSARVIQILTNLVGNALHYTPDGGAITVSAQAQAQGSMMEVSVTDTGIGIAKENQEKIFDRFFRADDPLVQSVPGTGLGLPITTSLVHMHKGEIWVESEVGQGSTFTFTLPLAQQGEAPAAVADRQVSPVLVVEDDEDVANLIRIHLESDGYEVVTVSRGEEAIRVAQETQPLLITLDIRLPDADGFVVLERLKKNPQTAKIPVVIVSVIPDKEKGIRLGALDVLGKPIDEKVLIETVRRILRQRGLVLVVDDDPDNRSLVRESLKRHGFRVRATGLGVKALQMAKKTPPELILLDLKLKDMDGYDVLQELKSDPATCDIPVVVMTGSLTNEELKQQRALALGAARFMTKPFEIEAMIREITTVFQQADRTHAGNQSSQRG